MNQCSATDAGDEVPDMGTCVGAAKRDVAVRSTANRVLRQAIGSGCIACASTHSCKLQHDSHHCRDKDVLKNAIVDG
jgi:hypothetical protein